MKMQSKKLCLLIMTLLVSGTAFHLTAYGDSSNHSSSNSYYQKKRNWENKSFGEMTVSIFVYNDKNRNGDYDLGDTPMGAVAVELSGKNSGQHNSRSNSGGYANFNMSDTQKNVQIQKEGLYTFKVIKPNGWIATSDNLVQQGSIRPMPGSPGDMIIESGFIPVGLAPELIIQGSIKRHENNPETLDSHKNIQVTAISPNGSRQIVSLSEQGEYQFTGSVGTWRIEAHDTTTFKSAFREVKVKHAPIHVSAIVIGQPAINDKMTTTLVDFESITHRDIFKIPKGYAGISWGNLICTEQMKYGGNGYHNGTTSGHYVSYNSSGHPITLSHPDGFNFEGGFFSVAWGKAEGESLIARAWRKGKLIATDEVELSALGPIWFAANYKNVTRVELFTKHYWQFVGDDFEIGVAKGLKTKAPLKENKILKSAAPSSQSQ